MPDVGVLNLQIRDDSAKAAEGLGRLASSLKRVQQALGAGLKLGNVAKQIEKLNQAVATAIPEESISRLERLAKAIDTLNKAGGINIKGLKQLENLDRVKDTLAGSFEQVGSKVQGATGHMEKFNQLVQQTAWTAGDMAEQFRQAFMVWNTIRSSMALGAGGSMGHTGGPETGWTYWKDGAIEVEGTVSDAMENVTPAIEGAKNAILGAGEAMKLLGDGAETGLTVWQDNHGLTEWKDNAIVAVGTVSDAMEEATKEFIGFKRVWNSGTGQFENVGYTQEEFDAILARNAGAGGMAKPLAESGRAADSLREKLKDIVWLMKDLGEHSGLSGLGQGLEEMTKSLRKLLSQFARIAKYRMIRAVIKSITEGVKEGTESYYRYSKAIGSAFAPAMDSVASSLKTMKNSIGAMLAPLIQSLIPYLQMAVQGFINVLNYANQFFALLRGQSTWSRATNQNAKAFDNVKKSAVGAAAAVKDLLADFDELNIIQSETDGGKGGGSGAKAMENYLGMFEEVNKFDSNIKSLIDTLKAGFGDVLKLIELGGIALLGWKLSNAFTGWLSKLGQLIAGLAIIDIGVRLNYGSGYSAGVKGHFDGANIMTSIAGAVATAIGGYLIAGGVGAAVGVGISVFATLYGYIQGDIERKDLLKWGTGSMTPEEIKTYVDGMFDFDVKARINIAESIITVSKENREKLNSKIAMFSQSLDKVKIGVDGTPEGLREAETAAGEVIKQLNKNMQDSQKSLEVLTKIVPVTSSNGGTTQSLIDNIKIADQTMSDYFQGLGQQIADWIDLGQQNQWKNNEAAMALALMEHQESIVKGAEDNKIHRDFELESDLNLSSMTRDNAQQVMSEEIARVEEYENKIREAAEQTAKDYRYLADVARNAGLEGTAKTYEETANGIIKDIKEGKILKEEKVKSTLDKMRAQWIETLKRVYGGDISSEVDWSTQIGYDFFGLWQSHPFIDGLKKAFDNDGGSDGVKRFVEKQLSGVFNTIDPQHIIRNAAQQFGFTIFDLLSPEDQSMIADSVYKAFEDKETADKILQAMGITGSAVTEKIAEEVENTAPAVGQSYQNVLNEMEAADWQHTTDAEFDNLLTSLRDKFGGDAVQEALNQLDIPQSEIRVPLNINAVPEDGVSVLGVPTEGGWWNNVWDAVLGGKPLETDAKIHVDLDVDEEDLSILDVIDKGGFKNTSKVWKLGGRLSANTLGAGAAGFSNGNTTPQQITVTQDDSKQKENIKGGTGDLLTELRSIVSGIQSLNRKNFTVNITPSTGLGRVNRKSSEAYEKISGDYIGT